MFFKFLSQNSVYSIVAICYVIYYAIAAYSLTSLNVTINSINLPKNSTFGTVAFLNFLITSTFFVTTIVGFINYAIFAFHNYKK